MKLSKLTKPELGEIKEYANFTDDEEMIFDLLSKGKTQKEISYIMSISVSTVERRVRDIKSKIERG